jgi:putative sugar O-methyltransferase
MNYTLLWKPRKLLAAVQRKITNRRIISQAIATSEKRFGKDPNYRPDLVPMCFAPRLGVAQDDSVILKRIIAAYKKAKVDQRLASEAFNVSNEWLGIYEHNLGPVMRALQNEDVGALQHMYQNFFRDACSSGLAGLPVNMAKTYFGPTIKQRYRKYLLADFLHRFSLWKERTEGVYPVSVLATPDVGNPYGYMQDDTFLRAGADYQHYYAVLIRQLLNSAQKPVVVELGGGFGGLAYFLLRDIPGLTYVNFDLPEALALASYYVLRSLPQIEVVLYGEAELSNAIGRPAALMMPSFEIMKVADKSVDISFNSYSLAEMSPATIGVYVAQIARTTRGHFVHVNHNRDAVVTADNFGVEDHGFSQVSRRLAGWNLGINAASDEYEYIYKA